MSFNLHLKLIDWTSVEEGVEGEDGVELWSRFYSARCWDWMTADRTPRRLTSLSGNMWKVFICIFLSSDLMDKGKLTGKLGEFW